MEKANLDVPKSSFDRIFVPPLSLSPCESEEAVRPDQRLHLLLRHRRRRRKVPRSRPDV